jgi:hypothetical protein
MTVLVLENFKLIVLFLLIGSIIGLSHLSGENPHGFDSVAGRRMRSPARAREILVVSGRLATAARRVRFVANVFSGLQLRSLRPLFQ